MVVIDHPGRGSSHPFADDAFHDGVGTVREGGAVFPDGTMYKSQVLKRSRICSYCNIGMNIASPICCKIEWSYILPNKG